MNVVRILVEATVSSLAVLVLFYIFRDFSFRESDLWYVYGIWNGSIITTWVIKSRHFPQSKSKNDGS